MKAYLKLLRVKHYIKNLLIFVPLFFGGQIFDREKLLCGGIGFVSFSLLSSSVYILNDLKDIEKDRKHPVKKNRPLASGKIKTKTAVVLLAICLSAAFLITFLFFRWKAVVYLGLYFGLNLLYSFGMKDVPIADIVLLASGFVIRIFYGGSITSVSISQWLYLVITTGSIYMGLGKRRNELLRQKTDTRNVLKFYNEAFLDKNMYVCVALADVFYALWTLEMPNPLIIWTVPVFIVLLMYYSLNLERDSDGDPVEVILQDKSLMGISLVYGVMISLLLYK